MNAQILHKNAQAPYRAFTIREQTAVPSALVLEREFVNATYAAPKKAHPKQRPPRPKTNTKQAAIVPTVVDTTSTATSHPKGPANKRKPLQAAP